MTFNRIELIEVTHSLNDMILEKGTGITHIFVIIDLWEKKVKKLCSSSETQMARCHPLILKIDAYAYYELSSSWYAVFVYIL